MDTYPVALKLNNRLCLVVGGGKVGERKIATLLECGAIVRVVSPKSTSQVAEWARSGQIELRQRCFQEEDLDGVLVVIAATDCYEVNQDVSRVCDERQVIVNAVDIPDLCSFYVPAVLRRGLLTIAVSTGGASPKLAAKIRDSLSEQFGPDYGRYLELIAGWRRRALAEITDTDRREAFLKHIVDDVTLELIQKEQFDLLKERLEDVYCGYGSQSPQRPGSCPGEDVFFRK
ncbi:MAG: bifunctional precorrin-2 dehydrogenase/sirohydrochlorin ferrochelatase [Gracilibacteraceae bacterium]|nr:bifunctional precorrin-2 dehydrogenase/sirohydrochlorin ferrochelatase [Gracilibacteraceae bacterium]